MTPEDITLLREREHAETRAVDLINMYPVAMQQAGDVLLTEMTSRLEAHPSPMYEFMHLVVWLGCHRVGELGNERQELDNFEQGDDDANGSNNAVSM